MSSPTGATYILWVSGQTLVNGTTYSSPQYLGSWQWGSSGAPHQLTNAYDGAEKMWRNSLQWANAALSSFSNLSIRAFSNTVPYNCSTSCARGDLNVVQLDANAAFQPQARVMHEMGHIASYRSNPFTIAVGSTLFADYCWPSTGTSGCSWNATSAEWRTASFEEGLASFFGDTAIYWGSSPEPYTCLSTSACMRLSTFNVETTTGSGACAANEGRFVRSVNRYLRDIYDTPNDPGYNDSMARPYHYFFDALAYYSAGTGTWQKDEMWNSAFTALDNRDGRSAYDFYANYGWLTGQWSYSQYAENCYP